MESTWLVVFWGALIALVYAQLGYFLVILFVSRFFRPKTPGSCLPSVSLIIPAHNEEEVIAAKLENALSLDYPADKLDILVGSDGSSDKTVEIAREFESRGVEVFAYPQRRGKPSVLNDTVEHAKGDVLCLCDANVLFEADSLKNAVRHLADPAIGAVSCDVRIATDQSSFGTGESLYYRIERAIQVAESRVGSVMGVDGGMYVIRKELFGPLPSKTFSEDFIATMQAIRHGFRVLYEPSAVAHENASPTARQEWRRRIRVSAGIPQLLMRRHWPPIRRPIELWQFISHKLLRWMSPIWLMALLASNVVLWSAGPFYKVTLIGQVLFYLSAACAVVFVRFRMTRCGGIPFYFVMGNTGLAIGFVKGLLDMESVTWFQADRLPMQEHRAHPPVSKDR